MDPWSESLGVALLAAGGALLGAWFSRLPKPFWLLGYFIPLLLILLYAAGSRRPALAFLPPISWILEGRTKFAIIGFIGPVILTTPLLKLPRRRDRIAVGVLAIWVVLQAAIWPFLA